MFNGKAAGPVPNSEVFDFMNKSVKGKYLYDDKIVTEFLSTYYEWISSSKMNKLNGLENFNSLSFVHGTIQSFDLFYAENKDRVEGNYVFINRGYFGTGGFSIFKISKKLNYNFSFFQILS